MNLYYDVCCRFCHISFDVRRLYHPGEPEDPDDILHQHSFPTAMPFPKSTTQGVELCGEDTGCEYLIFKDKVKHITGTGCVSTLGYSGYRISADEMKGCRDIQALVKKKSNWIPEDDDQDFERETNYVLTGIGNGLLGPLLVSDIKPVRHGIVRVPMNFTLEYVSWTLKATVSYLTSVSRHDRWLSSSILLASKYLKRYRCVVWER